MGIPAERTIHCRYCGEIKKIHAPAHQIFCSRVCAIAGRNKNQTSKKPHKIAETPEDIATRYIVETESLRQKLREAQAENKLLRSTHLHEETFAATIKSAVASLPTVSRIIPPPKPYWNPNHEEVLVLLLSDLHACEVVKANETDNFNEYDFDIFCRRMQKLLNSIVGIGDIHRTAFQMNELEIFCLGDLVSGSIHQELENTNEMPLVQSAVQTACIIAQFLVKLSAVFPKISFHGIVGNHARLQKERQFKRRYDSAEYIIYNLLPHLTAKSPSIQYDIPFCPWKMVKIFDHLYLLGHGDEKANNYGGIPYYGLSKIYSEFQAMYRKRGGFDLRCIGHYHRPADLGECLVNGSLIGTNEYSISNLRAVTEPSQKCFGVSREFPKTFQYDLYVKDAPAEHSFIYDPERTSIQLMERWQSSKK